MHVLHPLFLVVKRFAEQLVKYNKGNVLVKCFGPEIKPTIWINSQVTRNKIKSEENWILCKEEDFPDSKHEMVFCKKKKDRTFSCSTFTSSSYYFQFLSNCETFIWSPIIWQVLLSLLMNCLQEPMKKSSSTVFPCWTGLWIHTPLWSMLSGGLKINLSSKKVSISRLEARASFNRNFGKWDKR